MIQLELEKKFDLKETEPFKSFVKRFDTGCDYVSKMIKLYLQNCDQIEERMNIRMLAKKTSKHKANRLKTT